MSSGYSFTDRTGNTKIYGLNGQAIDSGYAPTPRNSKAVYIYAAGTGDKRILMQLPGNVPAPPKTVLIQVTGDPPSPVTPTPSPAAQQVATPTSIPSTPALGVAQVSDGSTYLNPSGGQLIQVPQGQPVPDLWVKQTTPPAADANVIQAPFAPIPVGDNNISTGETFVNPGNGAYVNVPAGNVVPNAWMRVPDTEIPPSANVIQGQDVAGVTQQAMQQAQLTKTITMILTGVGIAGATWLGYQIVTNPAMAAEILKKYTVLKDFVTSSAQIATALLVIVGISFGSYEFFSFYEANDGDIAATVGDMLSSALVIALEATAEGIIDLVKKLAEAIWDAIF
jgi:hypothetical protein